MTESEYRERRGEWVRKAKYFRYSAEVDTPYRDDYRRLAQEYEQELAALDAAYKEQSHATD